MKSGFQPLFPFPLALWWKNAHIILIEIIKIEFLFWFSIPRTLDLQMDKNDSSKNSRNRVNVSLSRSLTLFILSFLIDVVSECLFTFCCDDKDVLLLARVLPFALFFVMHCLCTICFIYGNKVVKIVHCTTSNLKLQ